MGRESGARWVGTISGRSAGRGIVGGVRGKRERAVGLSVGGE